MDVACVYDVVGGDPSFVTFVTPWKPPNKIKLFSQIVTLTFICSLLVLAGRHNSHYFLSRVITLLYYVEANNNRYSESWCNMSAPRMKEETRD